LEAVVHLVMEIAMVVPLVVLLVKQRLGQLKLFLVRMVSLVQLVVQQLLEELVHRAMVLAEMEVWAVDLTPLQQMEVLDAFALLGTSHLSLWPQNL
jgi:hypothetical protein